MRITSQKLWREIRESIFLSLISAPLCFYSVQSLNSHRMLSHTFQYISICKEKKRSRSFFFLLQYCTGTKCQHYTVDPEASELSNSYFIKRIFIQNRSAYPRSARADYQIHSGNTLHFGLICHPTQSAVYILARRLSV